MLSGIRPFSFYREILNLPQVRLVNQRVTSMEIIPKAEAVITVTGTAGWEGLMFGKPVVLFGHAFYEEFDEGVIIVNGVESLPSILQSLRQRTIPDKALNAFIAAVVENAPEGIISEPRFLPAVTEAVMDENNLDKLGKIILSRLEESQRPAPQNNSEGREGDSRTLGFGIRHEHSSA